VTSAFFSVLSLLPLSRGTVSVSISLQTQPAGVKGKSGGGDS